MDASVQRVQFEPVVHVPRAPERRRRENQEHGEEQPHFPLEPRPAPAHAPAPDHGPHSEPRSLNGEGLGEQLDVTA